MAEYLPAFATYLDQFDVGGDPAQLRGWIEERKHGVRQCGAIEHLLNDATFNHCSGAVPEAYRDYATVTLVNAVAHFGETQDRLVPILNRYLGALEDAREAMNEYLEAARRAHELHQRQVPAVHRAMDHHDRAWLTGNPEEIWQAQEQLRVERERLDEHCGALSHWLLQAGRTVTELVKAVKQAVTDVFLLDVPYVSLKHRAQPEVAAAFAVDVFEIGESAKRVEEAVEALGAARRQLGSLQGVDHVAGDFLVSMTDWLDDIWRDYLADVGFAGTNLAEQARKYGAAVSTAEGALEWQVRAISVERDFVSHFDYLEIGAAHIATTAANVGIVSNFNVAERMAEDLGREAEDLAAGARFGRRVARATGRSVGVLGHVEAGYSLDVAVRAERNGAIAGQAVEWAVDRATPTRFGRYARFLDAPGARKLSKLSDLPGEVFGGAASTLVAQVTLKFSGENVD